MENWVFLTQALLFSLLIILIAILGNLGTLKKNADKQFSENNVITSST